VDNWSNLAKVVYKRTYARTMPDGNIENWKDTIDRVIAGNVRGHEHITKQEIERLRYFLMNRKATPAGRGLWFSGVEAHERIGGSALVNCWFFTADDWNNYVLAQDLLMLGGGVGMSVEHRYVSKLTKIKKNVAIVYKNTRDADFIVPDSREGWNELTRRALESFFVTGKAFSYSTICIRNTGEPIKGFGGTSSGQQPLISFIEKLTALLSTREGKHLRPIDAADILCMIAELVVAGNVRRSALLLLGDAWDKEYLKAKRWDLGILPSYRSNANFTVVCDDIEDLHPLYWATYEAGEAFGLFNRKNVQTFGRMGERKRDSAIGTNPCGEALLEDGEPCNLQEIYLPNLNDEGEFFEAAALMHRWGKRVTMEHYHNEKNDEVVKRNRRIGTGITGCLQSPLFKAETLDHAYKTILQENAIYSQDLCIPESIRTTVIKPSGTLSLIGDCTPGIHPAYSKFYTRRVRFSSGDKLIPILKKAGHFIEPSKRLDNTLDHSTLVVDFPCKIAEGTPVSDEGFGTWDQLNSVLFAQKHWSDQSVSVTVYYKKSEIGAIKTWLSDNLRNLKTISFLCHNDHGFQQAPLEKITEEEYNGKLATLTPIEVEESGDGSIDSTECANGYCPIK
jgi:ribonucleotide reductase alpha subunit